jgi:hypothetical protein
MLEHVIEPPILISLILDIGNYAVFFLHFFIAHQKKLINNNLFFLAGIMLVTPFFVNGLLLSWTQLPDQSKYLKYAQMLRDSIGNIDNSTYCDSSILNYGNPADVCPEVGFFERSLKVRVPSLFFAFSPLISIESFKSIGFLNRALFIITLLFFIKKNYLPLYVKLFLIFSPSLIIYSSVTLRDNLILLVTIWSMYFFLKRYYIFLILSSLTLFIIKPQNFVILFFFFYLIIVFIDTKNKNIQLFHKLLILTSIPIILIYYSEPLLVSVNSLRFGFFVEQHGFYTSMTGASSFEPLRLNYELFTKIIKGTLYYLISPINNLHSFNHIIIMLEAAFIYLYLFKNFAKDLKKKNLQNIALIWIFNFFLTASIYGLFIFNSGSLARYRIVSLIFVLVGYELHKKIYMKMNKVQKV